jgi:hypothetical protein
VGKWGEIGRKDLVNVVLGKKVKKNLKANNKKKEKNP